MKEFTSTLSHITPPQRSTSLKRRSVKRDSLPAAIATPSQDIDDDTSTTRNTNNSVDSMTQIDSDDIIYVVNKKTVSRRVPMDTTTEVVPFDQLPEEVKLQPGKTLTWARQTPEFLYLETIVPPECNECLERFQQEVSAQNKASAVAVTSYLSTIGGGDDEVIKAAPAVLPLIPTNTMPVIEDTIAASDMEETITPYFEGQTPYFDSTEGASEVQKDNKMPNTVSNTATPALLIPGNYLWGS